MSHFRADCSRCCGLCCVVPDLLAVQGFRTDKPAETPCANLNDAHRCSIHATRQLQGYPACAGFDCFGAGQWITQQVFAGAKWTDSTEVAQQMFAAYRHWAPRFAAAALIEAALPHVRDDTRSSLSLRMTELASVTTTDPLKPTDATRLRRETLAMIRAALKCGGDSEKFVTSASPSLPTQSSVPVFP